MDEDVLIYALIPTPTPAWAWSSDDGCCPVVTPHLLLSSGPRGSSIATHSPPEGRFCSGRGSKCGELIPLSLPMHVTGMSRRWRPISRDNLIDSIRGREMGVSDREVLNSQSIRSRKAFHQSSPGSHQEVLACYSVTEWQAHL